MNLRYLALPLLMMSTTIVAAETDPYLWLEDVESERALDWVKKQNAAGTAGIEGHASFAPLRERLLAIHNASDRIPDVEQIGAHYYNFWKDEQHVRGIWRRALPAEYAKEQPNWEIVLDIDALNATEKANWVFKGADCIEPEQDRCLISLSRGGGDAVEVREFDLASKSFVTDGFVLPEAKSSVSWRTRDSLYIGTDFGPDSMTDSGYPRTVRIWNRGSDWKQAEPVYSAKKTDVAAMAYVAHAQGVRHDVVGHWPDFFSSELSLLREGGYQPLPKPVDADAGFFHDFVLLSLRSAYKPHDREYPAGSLIAIRVDDLYAKRDAYTVLFTPTATRSLAGYDTTRNAVLLNILDSVRSQPEAMLLQRGRWKRLAIAVPANADVALAAIDGQRDDRYFMEVTDFLTPTALYQGVLGEKKQQRLKQQKPHFKSEGLVVEQHMARSRDGTQVPYFLVLPKERARDGSIPTLLYGYGGFEVSQTPGYKASVGAAWLERGGAFVVANIRGGGEFGPNWHQAALKANRQRAYDDFIAVAESLIEKKITAPKHLGIRGGSNGGLLMGVMYTQRPDLFGAVWCQVPLLDMQRYHLLLAGASWMGEYGNPDVAEEWAYIARYSPYHNIDAKREYPPILFATSTRDDRVHPGHARKMAARLLELGKDVSYYENIEGGHGGSTNNAQAAYMDALGYVFLWERLK